MADKKKYGKYEVVGRLGVGGMGVVYKGYDSLINRHVAIKTMSIDKTVDESLKKRFYREAQSAGILNHRNIVTIFDMDEEDGQPYIAMELLSGLDLKEIIAKRTPLPLEKKIDIVAQACDGLDYAHKHGIVHRDIKPGNIRLLDNGGVKILDFGIARIESSELTKAGMVMGTVSYMSPEQIAGKKVDGRSDVFSMGVVFYELMTGRKPFPGEAITTIIYKIMNESPAALQKADAAALPQPVERIINRALEKDPSRRYPSAAAMAEELRAFLASLQELDTTLPEVDVGAATLLAMPASKLREAVREATAAPLPPTPAARPVTPPARPTPPSPKLPPMAPIGRPPDRVADAEGTVMAGRPPVAAPPPPAPPPPARPAPTPTAPALRSAPSEPEATAMAPPRAPVARPASPPPSPRVPARPQGPGATVKASAPPVYRAAPPLEAKYPPPAIAPAPEPPARSFPIVPLALGAVALLVLVGVLALVLRPTGRASATGKVRVDVHPWARVQQVVNSADNRPVDVGTPVTPCHLDLPAGKYEITLVNDAFQPLKVPIEVSANQTTVVNSDMPGFDVESVLKRL